jgi:SAM-dependent methyltransferase
MSIAEPVAGHRAKYDLLASHMSPEEAGIQFVGAGDPVLIGFMELEILRRSHALEGASVIDIGCGIGRLAKYLFDENLTEYLGLDIIPEILQSAIDAAGDRPNFKFAIVEEAKLPVAAFSTDIVCGFSLITHLLDEEIFEYFAEAKRVLRPGGVAVFSFMDLDVPHIREQFFEHARVHRTGHGDLLRFTTKPVLKHIADGAGFKTTTFSEGHDAIASSKARTKLIDGRDAPEMFVLGQSICVMQF